MNRLVIPLLVLVSAALLTAEPLAAAEQPNARTIVTRMKAALEPERSSTRDVSLVMASDGKQTVEWTARQAFKKLKDGKRMLTVLMGPADVKGIALLVRERPDTSSVAWIYMPWLRRVRQIEPVGAFEPFLGTDFTYADLGFVNLKARAFNLVAHRMVGKRRVDEIEEIPAQQRYYSRIVTWVATDSMLPLKRQFYDLSGSLWKTELFEDERAIQGVATPLRILMKNDEQHTSTDLRISHVRYDVTIPDDLFDPAGLPKVVDHPFWASSAR